MEKLQTIKRPKIYLNPNHFSESNFYKKFKTFDSEDLNNRTDDLIMNHKFIKNPLEACYSILKNVRKNFLVMNC